MQNSENQKNKKKQKKTKKIYTYTYIYTNDNRPTFQNNISGIIITVVADHFGTFHIVSKCKQTPVQTYSQIRQMKTDTILKFNNILANADYTSVLLADCPNYAFHSFMEIYTNAFNRACPVQSIKTQKKGLWPSL